MSPMQFTFSTLNFWRKLFVVIVWIVNGGLGAFFLAAPLLGEKEHLPLLMSFGVLLLVLAWWAHFAISSRHVGHQIGVLLVFLFSGNIVAALIMLSIIRVSRPERAAAA